jgi:hypothetical protein
MGGTLFALVAHFNSMEHLQRVSVNMTYLA